MVKVSVPCGTWSPNNHLLSQIAHASMLLAYLAPNTAYGCLLLHALLVIGKPFKLGSVAHTYCRPPVTCFQNKLPDSEFNKSTQEQCVDMPAGHIFFKNSYDST